MTTNECIQVFKWMQNDEEHVPSIQDTIILMRFSMLIAHRTHHQDQSVITQGCCSPCRQTTALSTKILQAN